MNNLASTLQFNPKRFRSFLLGTLRKFLTILICKPTELISNNYSLLCLISTMLIVYPFISYGHDISPDRLNFLLSKDSLVIRSIGFVLCIILFIQFKFKIMPTLINGTLKYMVLIYNYSFIEWYTFCILPTQDNLLEIVLISQLQILFTNIVTFLFIQTIAYISVFQYFYIKFNDSIHAELVFGLKAQLSCFMGICIAILVKYIHELEIERLKLFSGAIAHEVKSPMSSAYFSASAVLDALNSSKFIEADLIKSAKKSIKVDPKQYVTIVMQHSDYDLLKFISGNMRSVLNKGLDAADNILLAMSGVQSVKDIGVYSLVTTINSTLENYTQEEDLSRLTFIPMNDIYYHGSYKLMQHVLRNLLDNAIRYAGKNAFIIIKTERNKLYFKDTGRGIPQNQLPHLFELFYTKSGSGSGVGLALCKNIMRGINGDIEVHSIVNEYTEFILTFNHPNEYEKTHNSKIDKDKQEAD